MIAAWCVRLLLVALVHGSSCPFGENVRLLHTSDNICSGVTPYAPFDRAIEICFMGLDKKTNPVVFPEPSRRELNRLLMDQDINEVWAPVRAPYDDAAVVLHSIPSDAQYNRPAQISEDSGSAADCLVYNVPLQQYERRNCEEYHVAVCEVVAGHVRYVVGPVCPPGQVALPSHKACFSVAKEWDISQGIPTYIGLPQPVMTDCNPALVRDGQHNNEGMLLLQGHVKSSDSMCVFSQTSPIQIEKLSIHLHYNRTEDSLFAVVTHPERFLDMECFTDGGGSPHPVSVRSRRVSLEKVILDIAEDGFYWCLSWDELSDSVVFSDKLLVLRANVRDSPDAVLVHASPALTVKELAQALGVSYESLRIKRRMKIGFLLHVQPPMLGSDPSVTVLYVRNTNYCPSIRWGRYTVNRTAIGQSVILNVDPPGSRVTYMCQGDYNEGGYWTRSGVYDVDLSQLMKKRLTRYNSRVGANNPWSALILVVVGFMGSCLSS